MPEQQQLYAVLKSARDYLAQQDVIEDEDWHDVLSGQIDGLLAPLEAAGAGKGLTWCGDCVRFHLPGEHVPFDRGTDEDEDNEEIDVE